MTKARIIQVLQSLPITQDTDEEFAAYRRAAVLIPLFPENGELSILLTVRTHTVETHKGQIAFPGGACDPLDRDEIHTALRETKEEIGLSVNEIEVLGILDDVPVPSGFLITPVVGYLKERPVCVLNPDEVAQVFTVPLSLFADERNAKKESRDVGGRAVTIWHFQYGEFRIWGATAAIIRRLAELSGSEPGPPT